MSKHKHFLVIAITVIAMIGISTIFIERPNPQYAVPGGTSDQYKQVVQQAIDTQNPAICGRITFTNPFVGGISGISEEFAREGCYESYINSHPDKNICPSTALGCIQQYAAIWDQPSLCNLDRGCITDVADRYHSIQTCDLLPLADAKLCRRNYHPYNCGNNGGPCVAGSN